MSLSMLCAGNRCIRESFVKKILVTFNEVLRRLLKALILNYSVLKLFYLMTILIRLKGNLSVFFHKIYVTFEYFSLNLSNRLHKMSYTFLHHNLKYFECNSKSHQLGFCRSDISLYLPVLQGGLNKCHDFMEGLATDMD